MDEKIYSQIELDLILENSTVAIKAELTDIKQKYDALKTSQTQLIYDTCESIKIDLADIKSKLGF